MSAALQKLEVSNVRRFKPYPAYKPSGVEWLGDVPAHWEVKQLKWAIMFQRGHDLPADERTEGDIPVVTSSGRSATHSVAVAKGPGIVTGRYGTIGEFYLIEEDYWPLNTTLYGVDLRGNEPRFLRYMLTNLSPLFLLNAIKSAVPGVDRNDIHPVKTVIPSPREQRCIADFLDREMMKIDTLIARKKALIERLMEKRSTLISRTVTRGLPLEAELAAGLDPYPQMKPSGMDWLGGVPAHWKEMMLKRTWAACEYGLSDALTGDGPIKVLTMGNIQEGQVHMPENGALEEVEENMLLKDGDLLFNRTNSLAHVGKVGMCRGMGYEQVTFASYLVRIRANHYALPAFLNFLLNTTQLLAFLRCLALPSINQANLNPTRYGQIQVFLPPVKEQQAIVNFLDQETANINDMVRKVDAAMGCLQEYRTALITSAVTGKIDVRGAAA